MAVSPLYIGCDIDLDYTGARRSSGGTPLNTGTCTWSLTNSLGTAISSGTLAYVAASSGNYHGVIPSTVTAALTPGGVYTLTVIFSDSGYDDERVLQLRASYRTAT